MYEPDPMSRTGPGNVARSVGVDGMSQALFALRPVDRVVGGAVENDGGPQAAEERVDRIRVGDRDLLTREARARADEPRQVRAKLAPCAENERPHIGRPNQPGRGDRASPGRDFVSLPSCVASFRYLVKSHRYTGMGAAPAAKPHAR